MRLKFKSKADRGCFMLFWCIILFVGSIIILLTEGIDRNEYLFGIIALSLVVGFISYYDIKS